jgi:hypothetical protein
MSKLKLFYLFVIIVVLFLFISRNREHISQEGLQFLADHQPEPGTREAEHALMKGIYLSRYK